MQHINSAATIGGQPLFFLSFEKINPLSEEGNTLQFDHLLVISVQQTFTGGCWGQLWEHKHEKAIAITSQCS